MDSERIEATLTDGLLTIRIPKSEPSKPRRVEISGS
ncbi:Hsp20 family protein [Nocardia terpenica]|uniref:Hsp20 family protein n=2 Tax=Nocardia terpenica TaxID=455432 RepID=A0A6G9Z6H2_9NOCA|nr:Hsp20 family protein [Nocardia terpenica]